MCVHVGNSMGEITTDIKKFRVQLTWHPAARTLSMRAENGLSVGKMFNQLIIKMGRGGEKSLYNIVINGKQNGVTENMMVSI